VTDEASKLLAKAERALRAAEILLQSGDAESTTGRAYYAMFHSVQALLRERNLRYRKHAGVHTGFAEHFVKVGRLDPKYHRWLIDAFDARLGADYDAGFTLDTQSARVWVERAREFVAEVRRHLVAPPA
jgi:uncharacterized protein (UPF0332 family)